MNNEPPHLLTILLRAKNKRLKEKAGYDFLDYYDYLCEIAHPNFLGYEIMVGDPQYVDGFWTRHSIGDEANLRRSREVIDKILWVASFSIGTMYGSQLVFNAVTARVLDLVGQPYPTKKG